MDYKLDEVREEDLPPDDLVTVANDGDEEEVVDYLYETEEDDGE